MADGGLGYARSRPWLLALTLAPIPALISLLGMAVSLGGSTFLQLVLDPRVILSTGKTPWPEILWPLVTAGLLSALFIWLAVIAPELGFIRRRRMRFKRILVASACLLASCTLWLGVILGDVVWRAALGGLPNVEQVPPALQTSAWIYAFLVLGTAAGLYFLIRPRRK